MLHRKMIIYSFLIILTNLIIITFISADTPDYYTGLGQEYNVRYYSYFKKDTRKDKYVFIDELPIVDLEFGTFYKTISDKKTDKIIIGAFYYIGKLNWALSYDEAGNIIRIEKYDNDGLLISDKYYTSKGELYFKTEIGEYPIYEPYHNRKPKEDIGYTYSYITKGQGVEIIDRRDITKWFDEQESIECIKDTYYNIKNGNIFKETFYEKSNKHLYDRIYYYNTSTDLLNYSEYYKNDQLLESSLFFYEGNNLKEIEYRGNNDTGIIKKRFENGKLKSIIKFYKYYLPEVIVNLNDEEKIESAEHRKYDTTMRLLKTHYYYYDNGRIKNEEVKNNYNEIYETAEYEFKNNELTRIIRNGIQPGEEYTIDLKYSYDNNNLISAVDSGTTSSNITFIKEYQNKISQVRILSNNYQMIIYENPFNELNVDIFNLNANSGMVYGKEEKIIATKQINQISDGVKTITTVSNEGTILKYEIIGDEETQIINFNENKPYIFNKIDTKTNNLIYKEFYDESGNISKTINYDPENYVENFIEYNKEGKIISEYKLDLYGNLIAKLFYNENEKPEIYEEYNDFGITTLFSIRKYDENSNLINYSIYKNFGDEGFKLYSTQLYGDINKPLVVFIFDDKTHFLSSIQFNDDKGSKRKFIWRNLLLPNIKIEIVDYVNQKENEIKIKLKTNTTVSPNLRKKSFYNKIK